MSSENVIIPKSRYDMLMSSSDKKKFQETEIPSEGDKKENKERDPELSSTPKPSPDKSKSPTPPAPPQLSPIKKTTQKSQPKKAGRSLEDVFNTHSSFLPPGDNPEDMSRNPENKTTMKKQKKHSDFKAKPYSKMCSKWLAL